MHLGPTEVIKFPKDPVIEGCNSRIKRLDDILSQKYLENLGPGRVKQSGIKVPIDVNDWLFAIFLQIDFLRVRICDEIDACLTVLFDLVFGRTLGLIIFPCLFGAFHDHHIKCALKLVSVRGLKIDVISMLRAQKIWNSFFIFKGFEGLAVAGKITFVTILRFNIYILENDGALLKVSYRVHKPDFEIFFDLIIVRDCLAKYVDKIAVESDIHALVVHFALWFVLRFLIIDHVY